MPSPASILRDRLPELLDWIERYGRVPRDLAGDVAEHLRNTLEASAAHAEAAQAARRRRSEQIEAGIRAAVGALPLGERGAAGLVHRRIIRGPDAYGLNQVPDIKTVRRVLADMAAEQSCRNLTVSSTNWRHGGTLRAYASTHAST